MRHTRKWIGWSALVLAAIAVMAVARSYVQIEQQYRKLDAVRAEWMQLRQA
jgi:hypothetical protein